MMEDWTTHEGVADLFSAAVLNEGVALTIYQPQAKAIVAMWDSDFNDFTVSKECWPVYRHLCKKKFIVPHAATVERQVRRLAKKGGDQLNVTKYLATAVLALREATFQQQVRQHLLDTLGGDGD